MTRMIDVVFDAPPGPVCGRFLEVEDQDGHSTRVGEWLRRPDGYWVLRIPVGATEAHDEAVRRAERLRLADLFESHAQSLGAWTSDGRHLVELVAFMLRLDHGVEVPVRHAWGGHYDPEDNERGVVDPRWHVDCSGCDWTFDGPRSEAIAAGKAHEADSNPVPIR